MGGVPPLTLELIAYWLLPIETIYGVPTAPCFNPTILLAPDATIKFPLLSGNTFCGLPPPDARSKAIVHPVGNSKLHWPTELTGGMVVFSNSSPPANTGL